MGSRLRPEQWRHGLLATTFKSLAAMIGIALFSVVATADVKVTGAGKVKYVPDIAQVRFGVATEAKTTTEAWSNSKTVGQGVNRDLSIGFSCANPEQLLERARREAVADARKKAELFTDSAGVSLGRVVSISDEERVLHSIQGLARVEMAGQARMPIAVGEQEMTASVTLTYAIHDNSGNSPTKK